MRKSIDRQERNFLDKSDLAPRTDVTLGCREGGESSYPEHPVLDETASKEAMGDLPESEGSAANVTETDEALEALPAQDSAPSASMDDDVKVIWPGLPLSARTEPSDGPATVELHSEQQPPDGTWSWAQVFDLISTVRCKPFLEIHVLSSKSNDIDIDSTDPCRVMVVCHVDNETNRQDEGFCKFKEM